MAVSGTQCFCFISNFALCLVRFTRPIVAHERLDNHPVIFLHPNLCQSKEFYLTFGLIQLCPTGLSLVPGILLVSTPCGESNDTVTQRALMGFQALTLLIK